MPVRFPAYRMRDGITPLAEDYFNPVLADIDARIAQIEDQRASLQGVIDDLTAFGLQRIDVLIGPAIAQTQATLDALQELRADLEAAIGNVGNLATQAQLAAAIAAETAARQSAITAEQTARQSAIAAIHTAIAQPSAATYTYDAQGRVTGISETLPSGTRSTTITYDAQGRVSQTVETYAGATRTTTYTYDSAGLLTGLSVTGA